MNLDLFSAEHLCSYFTDVSFHRVNVENGLDVSTSSNQRLLKRVSLYFFHFFHYKLILLIPIQIVLIASLLCSSLFCDPDGAA